MKHVLFRFTRLMLLCLSVSTALTLLCLSTSAHADDKRYMLMEMPDAYEQECVGCHVAYPPGMLPAKSWRRIMSGLKQHYGTDASVEPETAKQIETWLVDYAGRGRKTQVAPPEDRITKARWFVREHRHIDPEVWKLESVKSAANCQACHSFADQGSYDDDELVIPKGLSLMQKRAFWD